VKIVENKYLKVPHGNTIVWRYMGLDKFIDLIVHERLFFTNAKNLTDQYEISIPEEIIDNKLKSLQNKSYDDRNLYEEIAIYKHQNRSMKELTLLNCWSINRNESYALWKIYLDGAKIGVAIKTTISNLKKSIENGNDPYPEDIYIGSVEYSDKYSKPEYSRFDLITRKKSFYKFENELRLFIIHFPRSEGGIEPPYNLGIGRNINVDINYLIDNVYLSPFAGKWFEDSFRKAVVKINPSVSNKLITSSIRDQ